VRELPTTVRRRDVAPLKEVVCAVRCGPPTTPMTLPRRRTTTRLQRGRQVLEVGRRDEHREAPSEVPRRMGLLAPVDAACRAVEQHEPRFEVHRPRQDGVLVAAAQAARTTPGSSREIPNLAMSWGRRAARSRVEPQPPPKAFAACTVCCSGEARNGTELTTRSVTRVTPRSRPGQAIVRVTDSRRAGDADLRAP
jgi:hypothetical protein